MIHLFKNKVSIQKQFVFSFLLIIIVSALCLFLSTYLGYRVVAFILLVTVSLIAALFDILPVLMSAILSALIWDFFFLPPHYTLHVESSEDMILLLMYFVIAMVSSVLTFRIRRIEKMSIVKEEKAHTLQLYNTMFNSLSHELRTPLAAIIGATDNLQHNYAKLTAENRYELINEIALAGTRLNRQVDNLLNMSRIESGVLSPSFDWCDINEIVYGTVQRVEEMGIKQKIHININPAIPLFKLDKGMLEQILYNLLINAVSYTPAKSVINVEAACYTDMLRIIVSDNGPGFPADEIQNAFNKFYRLTHSKPGGTGLGLSIVKGFTEAMGGSVSLKNIDTGGAMFTLHFPAEVSYLKNLKNE
jgi:two-component system sensor histidine kinase KdpD